VGLGASKPGIRHDGAPAILPQGLHNELPLHRSAPLTCSRPVLSCHPGESESGWTDCEVWGGEWGGEECWSLLAPTGSAYSHVVREYVRNVTETPHGREPGKRNQRSTSIERKLIFLRQFLESSHFGALCSHERWMRRRLKRQRDDERGDRVTRLRSLD